MKVSVGVIGLALLTYASSVASTPVIRSLVISGNSAFTTRELMQYFSSRESLGFSSIILNGDCQLVLDRYRAAGYLDATVLLDSLGYSPDSAEVDIELAIREGRRTLVGRIDLVGEQLFPPGEILARFDTRAGEPLDESTLEGDVSSLLERYEHSGYPLAQCDIKSIRRAHDGEVDSLDITMEVDEGPEVRIDEIQVQGNKETNPSVVVRETRLRVGEPFDPVKVDAIRGRLQRLNIFSDVAEPELYMRDKKGGLLIKVREGNTNTFDGVIGYVPPVSEGVPGYVTGLVSVSMRNLFGTGRRLSFNWQREDRNSQELGVRYVEPWVLGFPVNLGGGFLQRQQDSSYVRRVVDLKAELMISEELSASILFGSEEVIPSSDSTTSRVFRSSTTSFGIELQYDTRDDIYSPTKGARYRTDYSYGRKLIRGVPARYAGSVPERSSVQRFTFDLDAFLSTFARQVLAFGIHGRELQGGQIEEGDMFRLGGMRTLRGYRENQFIGSRIAWSNTEYRFLLARRSFIYGFVDGGYYLRPADDLRGIERMDAFKYGYGIGVQLETGLGNLGVSFALGQGDTFADGKIHFGLINDF